MCIRKQRVTRPLSFFLVAASFLPLNMYNKAGAEPLTKGSIPWLERIGREYAANRDRIRTWRGKVEFSQKAGTTGAESLQEVDKAIIRFVYSGEKQHCLSVQEQTWSPDVSKGLRLQTRMLTDDGYYIYDSFTPDHFPQKFLPALIIEPPSEGQIKPFTTRPGDFHALSMITPGSDVSAHVLAYAKMLKEGKEKDLEKGRTLLRKGNIVKLRIELPGLVNEYVFDLDLASSLVEFVSAGSDPSLIWKCKMQKVAGVFIPEILTVDEVRGREREVQEMKWFDQVVNEPISKDEFTTTKLGVHRGDRVQDNRTGARYRLTDVKLPPRTTPGIARELRQTAERPSHIPHYLFLVGLFLLGAVVAVIIYRRYRSAKARG